MVQFRQRENTAKRRVFMTKELICSISIFIIMLIDPIAWFFFCGKIQYQKTFKRKNRILSLFCLVLLYLTTKLISEAMNNYAPVSFIFQNCPLLIYFLYATKVFGMDSRVAVSFVSMFNISCTLLEYIFSVTLLVVLRVVTPEYVLQPNLFRVLCFLILNLGAVLILYTMSNMKKSHILILKEKRVCRTFGLLLFIDLASFFLLSFFSENRVCQIFNYEVFIIVCETLFSIYEIYIIFIGIKNEQEIRTTLDNATTEIQMLQQNKLCSDNAKKVVHDCNNHFCTIGHLLDNQLYERAFEYIKQIVPELESARVSGSNKNVLATMLFRKQQEAKKRNVSFDFSVGVKDVTIPIMDVSTIIFNMSDNAIEYCSANNLGASGVIYRICVREGNLIFECFNMITKQPQLDASGHFVTSKSDKENHGLGLLIMEECASKYGGVIVPELNDKLFIISARFPSKYAVEFDEADYDDIYKESDITTPNETA